MDDRGTGTYTAPQKDESTLLHTYVLNEYFTADRSWSIGQLVEAQWDFKLSEEFEIDVIFLQFLQFSKTHSTSNN